MANGPYRVTTGPDSVEVVKTDFKKTLKELYNPKVGVFSLVEVPTMQYLMVDGHGDPNIAQEYQEAITSLYSVAYTLKFYSKSTFDRDYVVPPLEGLWWADDLNDFRARNKANWHWTAMIMVPDWLGETDLAEAIVTVQSKRPEIITDRLRLEQLSEGLCVQTMHIGPYDDETPTLLRLHDEWLPEHGYRERMKHHEIYLSDPRKTAVEKLKTIIRQPIEQQ